MAVLAYLGTAWTEVDAGRISAVMESAVGSMPVPFMGPPVLVDRDSGFAVSQMPAIMLYQGETLGLMPATPRLRALTIKVVNDANDVINELSLNGGCDMWTGERWQSFFPRLRKWMTLWEELGRRHRLEETTGYLLGGTEPGLADIATATLWTTMAERFSRLAALFAETAPHTFALSKRLYALPSLAALRERALKDYGDAYAVGQIGHSMAKVLVDKSAG